MGGQSSYSICAKIQVLNPKSSEFLENGVLFLDTYPEFEIRTTRRLEEIIDISKISVDAVIAFDLPRTPKNDAELGDFVNPNILNFDFAPIPVQVIEGGQVLPQNLMHVKECSERDKTYTIELRTDDSHWIVGAKKLRCKDIEDWPEFTINIPNVISNWGSNYKYLDGDVGIWFPLVYYGAWFEKGNVTISDMRPHIHLLALLQYGFSHIGWIFKCPFLETDFGRQLGCYLIDPLYGTDSFDKRKYSIKVRYAEMQSGDFSGKAIFGYEEYDEDGAYDPTSGNYSADGLFDLKADILISFEEADTSNRIGTFQINIIKRSITGIEVLLASNFEGVSTETLQYHYLSVEANFVPLFITDVVYVTLSINDNVYAKWNVYFESKPANSVVFKDGQILNPPSIINRNLTLYAVMSGLVHLINGKIDTDVARRTVTVYAAFTETHFGTEVEGYYKENIINDLIPYQAVTSSIISAINIDQKRYLRLQFKESTDERIKGLNFPKDNPPFSKNYDIGEYLNEETEKSENPLFEPTINDDITEIVSGPLQTQFLKIGLPFMVDNDAGKLSFNIGARILYFAGDIALKTPEGYNISWRFNNTTRTTVPFAFQFTTYKKGDGSAFDRYLVYGDREEELFTKFWRRDIIESIYNFKAEILHYSLPKDHFTWSFREYYKFQSKNSQVLGRLIESKDFDGCGNTLTPLVLIPQSNRPETFEPDPDANNKNCSSQRAKLIVTKVGDTYNFTVDNSAITRTIISQTIRWKYVDSNTWTVGTSVSNPTGKFIVQVQTQIQGCPDNFDSRIIDPCGQNFPAIVWEYRYDDDLEQHCIKATIGGLLEDAILTVVGTKTVYNNDVGATSAYNEGEEYCGNDDKICISFEIQFDNDCDPITVESCYDFEDIIKSCTDNKPVVQCVHFGIEAFGLRIAGNWVSNLQVYFLQYRNIVLRDSNGQPMLDDDGAYITYPATEKDWVVWDGHEPLFPGTFEARVVVFWCDSCPPICSAPVVCLSGVELSALESGLIGNDKSAITKYLWEMDNFTWDWDKLSNIEKERARKLYDKKDWGMLMKLHNDNQLSYHTLTDGTKQPFKFCCGEEHILGIKAWFTKAAEDGII